MTRHSDVRSPRCTLLRMMWLVTPLACTKPPPEPTKPAPATQVDDALLAASRNDERGPDGAYALVSAEAWLYAAPDRNAHRIRFEDRLAEIGEPDPSGVGARRRVLAFRLDEEQPGEAGWVALRTDAGKADYEATCGVDQPGYNVDVRFFVRSEHILPTLKKRWSHRDDDGSEVVLQPGVALREIASGTYLAETPDLAVLDIALAASRIRGFVPEHNERGVPGKPAAWGRGPMSVRVGDVEVRLVDPAIDLAAAEADGKTWRIRHADWCTQLSARSESPPVPAPGPRVIGVISQAEFFIPSGTALTWPDGSRAGVIVEDIKEHDDLQVIPRGERTCIVSAEFLGDPPTEMCVPKDALHRFE